MSRSSLQSAVGAAVTADRQTALGFGSVALLGALAALAVAVAALSMRRGDAPASIMPWWLFACSVAAAGFGVWALLLRQQAMQARLLGELREARSEAAVLLEAMQARLLGELRETRSEVAALSGVISHALLSAGPVASVAGAAGHAPASASTAPADHGRDLFTASVAHDLGTPLRALDGFARILKEDHASQLDRLGNVHLDRVIAVASRMKAMLDALRALARLSGHAVVRSPADLSAMAAAVIEELRLLSPDREVAVHIEPGLHAEGDPALLRILLDNLLGNAWKYTGKKADGAAIRFERTEHAGRRAFTVADNGAGFDMAFADRLCEPWVRVHPASEFEGTGMGLASVRRIVTCHGGAVWFDAAVGRGCSVHFTLAPPSPTGAP